MSFRPLKQFLACGVLAAAFVPASWGQSPVKIGWLVSTTGPFSTAALAEDQGVRFAVEEINAAGGILGRKVELVARDTTGTRRRR